MISEHSWNLKKLLPPKTALLHCHVNIVLLKLTLFPAGCHKTATCRYFVYSEAKNQHFHPTKATRSTNSREIWHGRVARGPAGTHKISPHSVHGGGYLAPKFENFQFSVKIRPKGETFNRFLQLQGLPLYMRPNILHVS